MFYLLPFFFLPTTFYILGKRRCFKDTETFGLIEVNMIQTKLLMATYWVTLNALTCLGAKTYLLTFSIHVKGLLTTKLTSLRFLVERRRLVTSEVSYSVIERCCPVSEPSSSMAEC